MPAWTGSEVVRLLAISSPPASPLSPWPSPLPQIPFPPLPPDTITTFTSGGFRADYGFVATVDRKIMRDPERSLLWDH
nr:hypothetical protein [Tanacetum cinerariifolium]